MLVGCTDLGFPQAFDYHIDRARVVAVWVWPPHTGPDTPRGVDALILGPYPITRTAIHVCDLPTDDFVTLEGMDCFDAAGVDPVGDALPAEWSIPDLSDLSCDDRCWSTVPVRVSAQDAVGRLAIGVAHAQVHPEEDPLFFGEDLDAYALDLDLPQTAEVGDAVTLVASADHPFGSYHWYVSAGVLLGTGRTTAHAEIFGRHTSTNTLELPADGSTGTIQVAVVGTDVILGGGFTTSTWATATLEVR